MDNVRAHCSAKTSEYDYYWRRLGLGRSGVHVLFNHVITRRMVIYDNIPCCSSMMIKDMYPTDRAKSSPIIHHTSMFWPTVSANVVHNLGVDKEMASTAYYAFQGAKGALSRLA